MEERKKKKEVRPRTFAHGDTPSNQITLKKVESSVGGGREKKEKKKEPGTGFSPSNLPP